MRGPRREAARHVQLHQTTPAKKDEQVRVNDRVGAAKGEVGMLKALLDEPVRSGEVIMPLAYDGWMCCRIV